ncbi:MAG: asparagine synthase (glutamine-hydrolyzing) [Acetobacteraceae bacterium]|nr:asparagine synthase (glutamine-hydrolyzing) [Acetobacteraceae bacterium]
MCGIAGLALRPDAPPPDPALGAGLRAALAHRGPDGSGTHQDRGALLVQTRLAIIDLQTGDQPLFAPGGLALVGNGEIYNHRELRAALPGVAFATGSDCEPPLHLFRTQGLDFTSSLRGMYALAIHDPRTGSVVLARDPFGIKPLYLAETPHGIAFASEPSALVAAGLVEPRLAPQPRDELLELQFSTGTATPLEGITRLAPGETVLIRDGRIVERRHRAALPEGGPETISEAAALARLDAALADSVAMHQRSDVPYGLFLSGGIDSAAILAMMARLNERPVLAFTAGFDAPGAADERAAAREAAGAAGARHHEITVTEADFWAHLPAIAAAMDDPAADYAIVPTWLLAREACRHVKVVLSGEGGDEMFAGYGRYRAATRPWWRGGRAMRPHGILARLGLRRSAAPHWRDGIEAAEARSSGQGRSRLMAAQAADIQDWLPNDLLTKLDRCLMAHAVEGRTPFLDPVLAAAAFRLPDALKLRQGRGKYLLRRWLAANFPAARPFAPKQGFSVPVGAWISARGARLGKLVARQAGVAELCDPAKVEAVFTRASAKHEAFAAWTLLFYALWHRRHIERARVDADVFAVLE